MYYNIMWMLIILGKDFNFKIITPSVLSVGIKSLLRMEISFAHSWRVLLFMVCVKFPFARLYFTGKYKQIQAAWVWILALPFCNCSTLGKPFYLSQFAPLLEW